MLIDKRQGGEGGNRAKNTCPQFLDYFTDALDTQLDLVFCNDHPSTGA